jgi:hypothetical protein
MSKNYKIIVAHPDDEVIFFSSILKSASKIIICFNKSQDKIVSLGREKIKKKIPLNNILFLNLKESNVFNTTNWKYPKDTPEGLIVNKNKIPYRQNFLNLKLYLSKIINIGDTIYTHNPWGEYGHEEHVQVFKAIKDLAKKFKLTIFVDGYVSNKSYNLMEKQQHLLSGKIQYKIINQKFANKLMKIYILNSCWTFDEHYIWPNIETFFQVKNANKKFIHNKKNGSSPPLNFMSDNYNTNIFKKILGTIIPHNTKIKLKKFINNIRLF